MDRARAVALWIAPILLFLCFGSARLATLWNTGAAGHASDYWTGYLSDCLIAVGLFLVCASAPSKVKIPLVMLGAVFMALHYGAYEYILEIGAPLDYTFLKYAFDPTFVAGSMTEVSNPGLLAWMSALYLLFVAAITISKRLTLTKRLAIFSVFLFLMVGHFLFVTSSDLPKWRQYNPVHLHLSSLVRDIYILMAYERGASGAIGPFFPSPAISEESAQKLEQIRRGDLDGQRLVAKGVYKDKRPNILIVILEGITARSFSSLAGSYTAPSYQFIKTEVALKEFWRFKNFMQLSSRTNRGTYSLLCGDYPALTIFPPAATSQFAANGEPIDCLPRILAKSGYHTEYIQSAPLRFMRKDTFLPLAGFESVNGTEWFNNPFITSSWGVDDRTFFEQVGEHLLRLERDKPQPWMVSLLTSGTHHPYAVPPDWKEKNSDGRISSYKYLDAYLSIFLEKLRQSGILDNTIVVLTSDEVHLLATEGPLAEPLSRRWAPLFVSLPHDRSPKEQNQVVTSSDLMLSLLDVLDLSPEDFLPDMVGRSFFRKYSSGRIIPWGTPGQFAGFRYPDGSVGYCDRNMEKCVHYTAASGYTEELFHDRWTDKRAMKPEERNLLLSFLAGNEFKAPYFKDKYILGRKGRRTITGIRSGLRFLNDQGIPIKPGRPFHIAIDLKVESGTGSYLVELQDISSRKRMGASVAVGKIYPGADVKIRKTIAIDQGTSGVFNVVLEIRQRDEEPIAVDLKSAKLEYL